MPNTTKSPPRLKNLDDLFLLSESDKSQGEPEPGALQTSTVNLEYAVIPFELMDDYPDHPFRLYEGERKSDMVESIRANGILQSLILHALDNGRYHILSGHNRKYSGIDAGLTEGPAVIKRGLTKAEEMVYIVETNLMQRSFSDMTHSEKAAVIALQHSKLFSQGKRNDIIAELKVLENPHGYRADGTSPLIGEKFHSDKKVGEMYCLAKNTVARYLRVHQLAPLLKQRLDIGDIALYTAVTLSFLKENEQQLLDKCIELNSFKVDMKKADVLRQYSARGKLTDENVYLILSGEVGQKPKPNRTPTVKVSKSIYTKYFKTNQSAQEVQDIVEKALEMYFEKVE